MIRFGILSTAKIGVQQTLPAMQQSSHARVTAVASRDAKKAAKVAATLNAPLSFGSYEELLTCDDIDAVYIPLPTSHHLEWAIKAAEAGKHVLVEKPLALKAKNIQKLIKARDKHNVLVSEAFMVTYHPQWLKVRELIAKGKIGDLKHVQGSFSYYNVDKNNMRNRPELGGGALPDIGVYPTVVTRFVTGVEPARVQASVDFDPTFNTDRYASIKADFNNFELSFYVSTQMALRQNMVFHGTKGFIEINAPFNSNIYEGSVVQLHNADHSEHQTFNFTNINQYTLQADAFAQAVMQAKKSNKKSAAKTPWKPAKKNKLAPLFTLEDSVLNQQVIDAIYSSGKAGGNWKKV